MPIQLHIGPTGRASLISEAFNQICVDMKVEVRVSIMPNPGDPFNSMRLLHFRNFSKETIIVTQTNKKKTVTKIPGLGECDIMLTPGEDMPKIERLNG